MARTQFGGKQIGDGTVSREDLDVSTPGSAVIRKIIAGSGVSISYTGTTAVGIDICGIYIETDV